MAKPHFRLTTDGLTNLVSGMGTSRDKGWQAQYTMPLDDPAQFLAAYKASRMIARAIDLPAEDACREWREWQAEATAITKIEAEESRLDVRGKVFEARRLARLFGGAAILIGTGEKNLLAPLNPAHLGVGGVKYLTILARHSLSAGAYDDDVTSPGYGGPSVWSVNTKTSGSLQIHPSRLVIMHGTAPLADNAGYDAQNGWGGSVLPGMLDALRRVDEGAANVNTLLYEAKVDVVKVKDLMQNLQQRGQAYEAEVLRRLTLAGAAKGINGMLLLDAMEEYQQKSASFGGLPDVLDRFMQLASAAVGIPMTMFFMQSPGGLNATGESDVRNYYDRIKVQQTLHMQPAMAVLDECLIRSALGDRPDDLHYTWRPLWQPTAKERAEVGKISADTMKTALEMDAVSTEAAGSALVNALTESGAFPGLEGYAEEFPADGGADDMGPGGDELPVADAAPRTLYVHRKVLNAKEIIRWAKVQGFKTTLPAHDMHVTIAYSRAAVDWMAAGESWQPKVEVAPGGARLMEKFGEARVLLFASDELRWRHERIKEAGATWDHPEYQPHITISYDPDAPDLAEVEPYQGPIILGPEVFQEVNEDWDEGIEET
ncbi:anti-CBASS protein Acb1 family protein [Oceaniglobus trochenteri]|uniref:anti-CBASS protein Acb1 family protein n=1 Tax=Oceaniglobus trochenteri TaxID=2763260 RepID=UPI001CFFABA1|nr:anti-CBASS Acb1 family protein [Oceaniglobus trochenteri]